VTYSDEGIIQVKFLVAKHEPRNNTICSVMPRMSMKYGAMHKAYGLLQQLATAYEEWQIIAMDFITDLPLSEECDQL
jgi:hypothetical protein